MDNDRDENGPLQDDDELFEDEEEQPNTIEECLKVLSSEAKALYLLSEVPVLTSPLSALEFYREYVGYNRPVLIRHATSHWPATERWKDNDYFRQEYGDKEVTVAVTPNGLADSPVGDRFVMPEEKRMKFSRFLDIMESPDIEPGIYYIQKQNSNLTEEFPEFLDQVPELQWASEAFGKKPDAINFWLGDQRAVTSMHKDPYENIYCVVRGHKDIILHPPSDVPWIPYRNYKPAVFKSKDNQFIIEDVEGPSVPWICLDPLDPDLDSFPQYTNSTPIKVRVNAGDVLYLPSLWFHHLRQSQGCISVNFWYDMEFDAKYNYFNLLKNITAVMNKQKL